MCGYGVSLALDFRGEEGWDMWEQKDKERRGLSAPERVGPRSDGPG